MLTDYSRQGIGFIVMQQYCQCVSLETPMCCVGGWKSVLCGSRHLTAAEKNYSTGWESTRDCLVPQESPPIPPIGCKNLTFITDHKALTKIVGDKELKDIDNPRILSLKERTLMYNSYQVRQGQNQLCRGRPLTLSGLSERTGVQRDRR